MAVSNGVVDLLTRRLERLPRDVLTALRVMSCFGRDVSFELLIEKSSDLLDDQSYVYSFVRDMVQTTVCRGIEERERMRMWKEIADTLIDQTFSSPRPTPRRGRKGKARFYSSSSTLVNGVGSSCTTTAEDRVQYAKLDLFAGTKASAISDFSSALEYIEAGISFLDVGHWEHEYGLSLALFKNAAGSTCSLGNLKETKANLSEVSFISGRRIMLPESPSYW
eukprot:CAMPEP_0196143628 /NCGR_PEP_ID=MMETSP0910-20130528/13633_1 /TAXON_ID=49265 /ORGANISM="Thalassiosira rotula, Strain GSO102" /LENGTH=221 /DNA_ID=CAMNT_0041405111 /DNA_START=729 /DNA_END=1394 /DNA_ORIENTATION=-